MKKSTFLNSYLPVLSIFIVATIICIAGASWFKSIGASPVVIEVINALLFGLALIAAAMHLQAIKSKNPSALVRSVMGATIMKLFVLTSAVMFYVSYKGVNNSKDAIISGMILYLTYTIFEVAGAFKVNKLNHGGR
ncbi:hypothetical protein [Deminuibacter soli]|uniref:Uncharacterized protein n=1 Tax=Deminuibacter soli TaxID=2291815 RepID=A0A3E1NLG9_9BACT|nr:hypothetical protein [Deminuibacter soli]RFM28767.1 hypothetical protein DXN05_08285 [Deminuibacter soli]